MDVARITAQAIKAALERIRQAKPIGDNALVGMDLLGLRLREEGLDDNPESREWALQQLLHRLVSEQLAARRGQDALIEPLASEALETALAEDFVAEDIEREAFSSLYYRFLSPGPPLQMRQLAEIALPGYRGRSGERQVHRRMTRGLKALEGQLREREVAAGKAFARHAGAHPRERIRVSDAGGGESEQRSSAQEHHGSPRGGGGSPTATEETRLNEREAALLDALRDEERVVELSPAALEAIASRQAEDATAWRLSRVAAWSRPRYRLDERFVGLSLLVDRGEQSAAERWQVVERHADLQTALAESREPAMVLLGAPGSGKSTLLRRLELDEAIAGLRGESGRLPFYLPLSLYPAPEPGGRPVAAGDWLAAAWAARNPRLPALASLLAEGRMLLLLDGLNEMPHADPAGYRASIGAWRAFLAEMTQLSPGNRLLVSCRSLDYSAPLSSPQLRVPHVRVEPLDDEQVRRFIQVHHPARAEAIWSALEGRPQLDLVRTPFFLSLLLEQAGAEGGLARGRAGLFTGFLRAALRREIERGNPLFEPGELLGERDYRRLVQTRRWPGPHALPERGPLLTGLQDLAYGMQDRREAGDNGQVRVAYDRALSLLEGRPAEPLIAAGRALGVLDEDPGRDEILFFHQLLQEYFAARRLARQPEPWRVEVDWRADDIVPDIPTLLEELPPADPVPALPSTGWEETTRLAAAMAEAPDACIAGLMEHNLALAGRCAAEPELDGRLSSELLGELRQALVARSRDPEADLRARIAAGLAIGLLGDPRFDHLDGPEGGYLLPPMVAIAAGRFPIGRDAAAASDSENDAARDSSAATREERASSPAHEVELAAFEIGRFPVTNAEFARFMQAGGYEDERWWASPDARRWREGRTTADGARAAYRRWREIFSARPEELDGYLRSGQMTEALHQRWLGYLAMDEAEWESFLEAEWTAGPIRQPRFWKDEAYGNPAQPVVGICWYEARAYCAWLAAQTGRAFRLPSEVEWEAAARGREGRRYAYGDRFDPLRCNAVESHLRRTTPIGVFPSGDTPDGVADLCGNASEWTLSLYGPTGAIEDRFGYPYDRADGREDPSAPPEVQRVHRGGAWDHQAEQLVASRRAPFRPDIRHDFVGFRLACQAGA